jgi:hypothetical protein
MLRNMKTEWKWTLVGIAACLAALAAAYSLEFELPVV